jgi:hypothetical protein
MSGVVLSFSLQNRAIHVTHLAGAGVDIDLDPLAVDVAALDLPLVTGEIGVGP